MDKEHFARSFGYYSYEEMLGCSDLVFKDSDEVSWYVSQLPHGKYLTWDDAEIADDRVESHYTKEDAEKYLGILRNHASKEKSITH